MATISSAGIGSGLDVDSIVSALVSVERTPITQLATQSQTLQTKLSSYGQIKSYMSALRDAAATLARPNTWSQTTGSSSNAAAVTVATGSSTFPGSYQVQVSSLAASQSVATSKVYTGSTALVGAGTLSFEKGSWNGGSFSAASSGSFEVTLTATDTLETARDKINAGGGAVVASILSDSSGSRLVLRSRETGAENGFRVSANDADGGHTDNDGLSALSYSGPAGATAQLSQGAADAVATINGLAVRSSSNTLKEVMDGMTLTLGSVTTAPVEVKVATDKEGIKKSIDTFVTAYNQLASYLTAQTKYDDATKTAGALQGDSSAVAIRNQMRSMLSIDSAASSMFGRLSDVGFDIQADGTIKMQSTKLDNALANPDELKKLFSHADATDDSKDGVMTQLRRLADSFLSFDGALATRSEGLQRRIDLNGKQQEKMEERVTQVEKRLRAQYSALDTRMAQLNSLSTYMNQQITLLNKSS